MKFGGAFFEHPLGRMDSPLRACQAILGMTVTRQLFEIGFVISQNLQADKQTIHPVYNGGISHQLDTFWHT